MKAFNLTWYFLPKKKKSDLVFVNGMYFHGCKADSKPNDLCLGVIRGDDANIIPFNSTVN